MTVTLTPRERIVLKEVCSGRFAKELAYESFVSENTIKSQLTSVYRKLTDAGAIRADVKRKQKDACAWLLREESDESPAERR